MKKSRATIDIAEIQRVYDKLIKDDARSGRTKNGAEVVRFMRKHIKDFPF